MTVGFATNPITAGDSVVVTVTDVSVANGLYPIVITATGGTNTHTITLHVRVTSGTSVVADPSTTICNEDISFSGSGFAASSSLTFYFNGVDKTAFITGTTTTDGSGNFSGLIYN